MTFASKPGCTIWVDWIGLETSSTRGQARIPTTSGTLVIFVSASPPSLRRCSSPDAWQAPRPKPCRRFSPTRHLGRRGIVLMRERPSFRFLASMRRGRFQSSSPLEGNGQFDSASFVRVLRSLTPPSASDQRTQYLDKPRPSAPPFLCGQLWLESGCRQRPKCDQQAKAAGVAHEALALASSSRPYGAIIRPASQVQAGNHLHGISLPRGSRHSCRAVKRRRY